MPDTPETTAPATLPPRQALEAFLSGAPEFADAPEATPPTPDPATLSEQPPAADATTDAPPEPEIPAAPENYSETLQIDGAEVTVSRDELRKGYLRQASYTRAMQAQAEQRRALEAETQQAADHRAQYAALLAEARKAVEALTPQEPNWSELRQSLTAKEYADAQDAWRVQTGKIQALKAEEARVQKLQQEAFQQQTQRLTRDEQDRLLNAVPEWRDPGKAQAERTQLIAFAKTRGFTDEELSRIVDHRAWLLLRDAWKAQQPGLQRAMQRTPKAAPPGNLQPTSPKGKTQEAAEARFKKSGRVADAAALLLANDMVTESPRR